MAFTGRRSHLPRRTSSACSIMQEPGCSHVGSSSVSGCQSTLIFEGIVLLNPLLPQQPAHTLSVRVNVSAVYIGGAFEGSVLPPAYKAPFTASVRVSTVLHVRYRAAGNRVGAALLRRCQVRTHAACPLNDYTCHVPTRSYGHLVTTSQID